MSESKTKFRRIVIVIGMHRSGTSLCAHLLSVFGLDMADDVSINQGNERGHWERWEIVGFHDRILALFNRDWFEATHAFALPRSWWADPKVRAIRDEIVVWLRGRMGNSRYFGFKDPRTSRLLPLWREICAELDLEPQFFFCVRHPVLVAQSLTARQDVIDREESEYRWVVYNAQAITDLGLQPVCVLPYDDWFSDAMPNLLRMTKHLTLGDNVDDAMLRNMAMDVVAPELRHHAAEQPSISNSASSVLHRLLVNSADHGSLSSELRDLASTFCRFERLVEPVQRAASLVGPLQSQLADRDGQIAQAEVREAEVRALLAAEQARAAAATAAAEALQAQQIEALQAQLANRDGQIAQAEVREAEVRALLAAEQARAAAATAAAEALQAPMQVRP